MKNYLIIAGIALLVLVSALLGFQTMELKSAKVENVRLTNNQTVLNSELKTWKTKDSINVAQIAAIAYTAAETKAFNPELVQTVKDLGLQLKNVQSILSLSSITSKNIKTIVRDSIVYKDSLKCFAFEDEFTKLNGCFSGDSVDISLKNFDKLTTVVSKVPKHKFLWWSWGVKGINLNIVSKNPDTSFEYAKYIEIK